MVKPATKRIRQVLIGILAVLSLSVSAVAACACSHHEQAPKESTSCHSKKSHHKSADSPTAPAAGESCVCVQPQIKVLVKGEGFKLKKQESSLPIGIDLKPDTIVTLTVAAIQPDRPVISSSGFLDSRPSRGPPAS